MEISLGPAALGGIIMCVALMGWMLGRWQGGTISSPQDHRDGAAPITGAAPRPGRFLRSSDGMAPATPRPPANPAKRRGAMVAANSLGALHAEVSAYRRAEQVLSDFATDQINLLPASGSDETPCHSFGRTGQPACASPIETQTGYDRDTFGVPVNLPAQPSTSSDSRRV